MFPLCEMSRENTGADVRLREQKVVSGKMHFLSL